MVNRRHVLYPLNFKNQTLNLYLTLKALIFDLSVYVSGVSMSDINRSFLDRIMPKFREWLKTEEGEKFAVEREEKDHFIRTYFTADKVEEIDEGILRQLIRILWSFEMWTNKDWLLDQMLQSELPEIREAFKNLLYGRDSLAGRFDKIREIRMMGAATISEILAHHDHSTYPIWNKRAKRSLIKLGINANLLPKSSQISGSQYANFVKVVKPLFKTVSQSYPEINDLLMFDFLLYYISTLIEEKAEKPLIQTEEKFDHDNTILKLLQLGDSLGFEIQKEVTVATGCRVDAIWKSRIANLGMITYAFEVHKSGSRDSAILKLQRISNADPTVQKVVIVSTDNEIEKFKMEIASLTEEFRNAVGYFSVEDLEEALLHQESLKKIMGTIGLMRTKITAKQPQQ
jgi:hypothetical protein